MVFNICKAFEADRYVASVGAEEYMRQDNAAPLFKRGGIAVDFMLYEAPRYPQLFGDFVPNLSVLDLFFNCGPFDSVKLLNQAQVSFWSL